METDVVCGMRVDPAKAAGSTEHEGKIYYFCSKGCLQRFQADPNEVSRSRLSARHARDACGARSADARQTPARSPWRVAHARRTLEARLRSPDAREYTCPMHPEVRQRAGLVPDLRHGARAGRGHARGAAERRARRHEPPVLVVARADGSDPRLHGRRSSCPVSRCSIAIPTRVAELDRARARDAGRAVGWLAVLRARLGVDRQPSPQHVHADRARRGRGVSSSASSRRSRPALSGLVPHARRRSPSTSSRPRSSSCWCCSGRCWSCARGAARARRFASCSVLRRRRRGSRAGRHRARRAARARARRRSAARPARRACSGRRRRARRRDVRSTNRW